MKYIKKIILKNFQSHKYTEIDFKQGLNVIVGPSDSGKTSILRAIKWVLYNEPMGDFFIREGEKECKVSLIFNDEVIVERLRTRSKNQYRIINSLGEVHTYEGFGYEVPLEVIETTGIKKVSLDSDEERILNLSEQLSGAFLLSERDSVKASSIGRLVGVNIIDDALRVSLRDRNELNSKIKMHEEKLIALRKDLKKYEYLKKYQNQIKNLEDIYSIIKLKQNRLNSFKEINKKLKLVNEELYTWYKTYNQLINLDKSINSIRLLELKLNNYKNFINISDRITTLDIAYFKTENEIINLKSVDKVDKIAKMMERKIKNFNRINQYNNNLNHVNKDIIKYKNTIISLKNVKNIVHKEDHLKAKIFLYNKLINYYSKYLDIQFRIKKGITYIRLFDKISISHKNQIIIEKNINKLQFLLDKKNKLDMINAKIKRNKTHSMEETKKGLVLLKKYKNLLKQYKRCPYCNSYIDDTHLDNIEKELWI